MDVQDTSAGKHDGLLGETRQDPSAGRRQVTSALWFLLSLCINCATCSVGRVKDPNSNIERVFNGEFLDNFVIRGSVLKNV